jgi:hypothetical protein
MAMSLATWIAEFYPVPAGDPSIDSEIKLIEHSLRKWRGALPENTARHQVRYQDHFLIESLDDLFMFGGQNCSLCAVSGTCLECPFTKRTNDTCLKPYQESRRHPIPMIKALKELLRLARQEAAQT